MSKGLKYTFIASVLAAAIFTGIKGPRSDIPPDLRDAVADKTTAWEVGDLQNISASDFAPAGEVPVPMKIFTGNSDDAIQLSRDLLDKSLQHQSEYPDERFWKSVKILRAAFDNPFDIRTDGCGQDNTLMYTKKKDYYLEQRSSKKKNIIYVCRGYNPPVEMKAQDFLHETSHLALVTFENEATELEMMVTHLGGGYPVLSGYVSYSESLTPEDLAWLGYGFLAPSLGITSKLSFHYQQLRAAIAYDDFEIFTKELTKLKDERKELLAFVDIKGLTLADMACKPQRQRFADYLAANFPGEFKGCKQRP